MIQDNSDHVASREMMKSTVGKALSVSSIYHGQRESLAWHSEFFRLRLN